MKFILFILIIITALLIFTLSKSLVASVKKSILITILCSLIIIHIIIHPDICLNSALNGLNLFIKSVFVYLFPFLVLINIMLSYNAVTIYSKTFGNILCKPLRLPKNCSVVLIVSILCGYPLGAKYACDLYKKNLIDHDTCNRLISIASNPSPLFIIGSIGNSMLKNNYLGFILLFSCYISCFVISLIIPPKNHIINTTHKNSENIIATKDPGDVLKSSIDNALKTCMSIGGFVIFFSVISEIIKNNILFDIVFEKMSILLNLSSNMLQSFILGIVEMTNGCNLISLTHINTIYKVVFISFFLGFSGLSIIAQVYSIIFKYDFSIKKYTSVKLLQGVICSIISLILYKINSPYIINSVFKSTTTSRSFLTTNNIFAIIFIILIIPFILNKLSKLFNGFS